MNDNGVEDLLADSVSALEANDAADEVDGHHGDDRGVGREAAALRRRLREAEAERDQFAGQLLDVTDRLTTAQRREAEAAAGVYLERAEDIWLTGAELGALLDDEGHVDPVKVAEVSQAVLSERPHWRARLAHPDPDQGKGSGGTAPVGWATMFGAPK